MDAVQAMEQRQVRLETSGPSGMPTGLHLNYEEDFLNCQSHQVSGVFTDPSFLPNMVNSVYKLVRPPVLAKAPPFATAKDHPTTPVESVDDRDGTTAPSPSPSTAGAPMQRRAGWGYPQPLSRLWATLALNQIKSRSWNLRKIPLIPPKCSHPHQIMPSGSRLVASQMVQRTLKTVSLPPRG